MLQHKISRRNFMKAACGATTAGTLAVCCAPMASAASPFSPQATGTQQAVLDAFDWGPGVVKTILILDRWIAPSSVSANSFRVKEVKPTFNFMTGAVSTLECERAVLAAYTCNERGERVVWPSQRIALEMNCTPFEGFPIYADSWHGRFGEDYTLTITLTDASTLKTSLGVKLETLTVNERFDWDEALIPVLENVDTSGSYTASNGATYAYCSYEPQDSEKHPLVIWLHGAGEGGTDIRLPMLGNKATVLCGEEFQGIMGGAYVLAPQCPDFWLTYNENSDDWQANPGLDSVHLAATMELIRNYVAEHPNVDTNRIYLTGCSNGGFMTMNLILRYPDYFAAAVPCCEAFIDEGITEEMLAGIKNLPIWFVFAKTDPLVVPELYELPTIERLHKMGAPNVHASIFDKIVDLTGKYSNPDGTPYDYGGHSCWVHFFNNDCVDEAGVNLWSWLAAQHR